MTATIYDIAEESGVSIATVSRAFSGHPRVAASTRERVFEVAKRLGYEPNVSAQGLARSRTNLVAAVVPLLSSYFFMEVIRGVQARLTESDLDLLVFTSPSPDHIDSQIARAVQRGRADGILLCSTPMTPERAEQLKTTPTPVALVDLQHPDFESVSIDNREGGYVATQHLIGRGAERIAFIVPEPLSVPATERRNGYRDALQEAGLEMDDELVVLTRDTEQHGYTRRAGYTAMQQLLALEQRPDAVFAASDVLAIGALRAIREAGLRVPRDLAVIGYDDIRTSADVGLSTLSQPMFEMGRLATDKLLNRIADPDLPVTHTVFSARLSPRDT